MWEVEFYVKPNGRCPVDDFRATLSPKTDQPFVAKAFERLEKYGHKLGRPHTAYLRNHIYEMRVRTQRGQLRFLNFFVGRERIVITHGLHKKTKAVPEKEIKRAIEYMQDFLDR